MKRKEWMLIAFFLLVKALLPFVLSNPAFELHRDEYLYYEQGQHLSFGYLENPPLIGLLAFISSLFGGSFFWIKFWPALFGALTLLVTLRMVKELGGGIFAQSIAALGILFSAYLRTHFLFQPNFLDIFFWSLSAYYLLRFINTQYNKYIFLLALALALGWYGKYSVLFFIVALMLSLLLTYHRKIFLRKQFWTVLLLACLLILPNILWQYFHKWPLVHHMKELQETQLQNINRLDFIKEQILMLLPVAFVWIGGTVWLLRNKKFRIVAYCYLLIILLLMMGSGKGYYALGAYPMLLAAGGVWAERISIKKTWLRYAFTFLILILSFPFVPILLPISSPQKMAAANKKWGWEKLGILKWEDGKNHPLQQDFADMLGWKELAQKTETFYNRLPDSVKNTTMIYGGNYGIAGALRYYSRNPAFQKKVFSFNGSFLLWTTTPYFKNLLLVDEELPKADNKFFPVAKTEIIDSCTNALSRQQGSKVIFFRNVADSTQRHFLERSRQRQQQFGR